MKNKLHFSKYRDPQLAGAEHRQKVAHGASRGIKMGYIASPGGAKELWPTRSQIS
jgi:hypothetical protein